MTNKSNFPTEYIVPLIVALLIKYTRADWDFGYRYTVNDLIFWVTITTTSYT